MCYHVKDGKKLEVKIAEKDIPVVKYMQVSWDRKIVTPWQGFQYTPGQVYTVGEANWHETKQRAKAAYESLFFGFHSYEPGLPEPSWAKTYECQPFDFIIPAGSEYIEGGFADWNVPNILSQQMKMVGPRKEQA